MYVKIGCVVFRMNIRPLLQYQLVRFNSHTELPCGLSQSWTRYPGILNTVQRMQAVHLCVSGIYDL